jgi:hypothetical protein
VKPFRNVDPQQSRSCSRKQPGVSTPGDAERKFKVPSGTAEGASFNRPGLDLFFGLPGIKMPGYFQMFLRNTAAFQPLKAETSLI